ncbi:MAG: DUF4411 family protein [Gammaproteobacteria bacterium]|nr:DUF4411 family protein [Gammaproteobacteria bacterium]
MLYLLDANTLIDAKRDYYPINSVPEFWEWLIFHGQQKTIKIPIEVYEEFSDTRDSNGQKDDLAAWSEQQGVKEALLFSEEADQSLVSQITYNGYTSNPTDDNIITIGRDPFLMSYALRDLDNRCIVSTEASKPKKQGANRKVPDVCNDFGIRCINSFQMFRELNFNTNWKNS